MHHPLSTAPRRQALTALLGTLVTAFTPLTAVGETLVNSFEIAVLHGPMPVRVQGQQRLVYELHLTNFASTERVLVAIRVMDAGNGAVLARFAQGELAGRTHVAGGDVAQTPAMAPGARVVVYLELDLAGRVPQQLRHVVEFTRPGHAQATVAEGAPVHVRAASRTMLGPPLRGGPWVAVHAPHWERGHRRVFYALDGRARLPGRFAVDWIRVGEDGHTTRGDADVPAHALGYGEAVLAVADARVAALRDGLRESSSVANNPDHPLELAAGNFVVLALPDGRFATYEHLRPGSIPLRVGDKVRRGQVIGALGFTGDSSGPHLHFHVADGTAVLGSEGLPYGFSGFRLLGHYPRIEDLGSQRWQALGPELAAERQGEFPPSNSVLRFPR